MQPLGDAERAVRSGRRRRHAATVAAPLAVLALVGGVWFVSAGSLSGDEPPLADSSPSPVTAADLAGRAFVTTEGQTEETPAIIMFDSTELTIMAPTSRHTAGYRIEDSVLALESLTRSFCRALYCSPELLQLLKSGPTITLAGAELTLSNPSRTLTLIESDIAGADAILAGRTWGLQSIADGDEYLALPEGVQSTLEFDEGAVAVDSGCDTSTGEVAITDSTIEISSIETPILNGCPAPFLNVELAIQHVLFDDGPLAYVVEGELLTITSNGDALFYRAAER